MFSVCVEGRQIEGGPPAFQNLQGTTNRALGLLNIGSENRHVHDRVRDIHGPDSSKRSNLSTAPAPSFNDGDRSKRFQGENFGFVIEPQK
jgi:hypothetical protein